MKQRTKANLKGRNGITLIALVVTIIVLIILAGVSINLILGENGIITKARQASTQSKIANIEDMVNQKYLSEYILEQTDGQKAITIEDVVGYIEEQGYTVESRVTGGGEITGIKFNPETVSIKPGETTEVEVVYETSEGDGIKYYVEVEGKYYEVEYKTGGITINREATELGGETEEGTITAVVKTGTSAKVEKVEGRKITITATEDGGTTTITVKYNETYEKELRVNVVVTPSADAEPNSSTSFSTAYGKIDIIWVNTENEIIQEPLPPVLSSETKPEETMEKVTWTDVKDGEGNVTSWTEDVEAKSDWYNYSEQRWANAKTANTENQSYFVWIPRYAYRITYYEKDPVTNADESTNPPTGYYDGYGMWKADGTLKYKLESDTIEKVDGPDGNKYIVHPAFETDLDNGGWSEDLSGFWFAKYEMSGTKSTTGAIKSVPDVTPLNNMTIGDMYQTSRNARYGYTGETEEVKSGDLQEESHTSYMHSHLVKNSEWGAVAYLTHSKYGRNGEEITQNTSEDKTGAGLNEATYNTANGAKASTTGNIYGVYDMSGGMYEYAASFDKASSSLTSYGANLVKEVKSTEQNESGGYDYISTKYATAYTNGTSNYSGDTVYTVGKTGDSTKEVKVSSGSGWFSDCSFVCRSSSPFFRRGGNFSGSSGDPGVFCSGFGSGSAGSYYGFRVALCP